MKRWKKVLVWTGTVVAGGVAAGLVTNAWYVWTSEARLGRQIAAMRQAGDPVSFSELIPHAIPPDQNAATYLSQAVPEVAAAFEAMWNDPDFKQYEQADSQSYPLPPAVRKAIQKALDAHPKLMPLLERAADCPAYNPGLVHSLPAIEIDGRLMTAVGDLRDVSRVLDARMKLLIAEGRRDEAVRTAILLSRLARQFDRYCSVAGHMAVTLFFRFSTDAANLALQTGAVTKETRRALDAELAAEESSVGFAQALKNDRAKMLEIFRNPPGGMHWLIERPLCNRFASDWVDAQNALLAILQAQDTYQQKRQTIERVAMVPSQLLDKFNVLTQDGPVDRKIFLASSGVPDLEVEALSWIRALRVINALQGHVPASRSAIPPLASLGLPAQTTVDPYSGKPPIIRRLPDGWMVYSVGARLKDNGGTDRSQAGRMGGRDSNIGYGPP
jgi:hypothetical protein